MYFFQFPRFFLIFDDPRKFSSNFQDISIKTDLSQSGVVSARASIKGPIDFVAATEEEKSSCFKPNAKETLSSSACEKSQKKIETDTISDMAAAFRKCQEDVEKTSKFQSVDMEGNWFSVRNLDSKNADPGEATKEVFVKLKGKPI